MRAMQGTFVLIWSTGFIVARYGMPYAPPLTFLAVRFALSLLCFGLWVLVSRAPWPRGRAQWWHLAVTGVFLHAGYLAGGWGAIKAGLGAGTVALLMALQPVLTALWLGAAGMRGSRRSPIPARQWLGLLFGVAGVGLVVGGKLGLGEVTAWNVGLAVMALASITIGTLYQKRHVAPCDARTANAVQLLAAFVVTLPLALLETEPVVFSAAFLAAMAWSVLGLTLGASSLLYLLIQRGAATRVTSLFYLVPLCTAFLAWLMFGERLTPMVLLGAVVTVLGVGLVVREPGLGRDDQASSGSVRSISQASASPCTSGERRRRTMR